MKLKRVFSILPTNHPNFVAIVTYTLDNMLIGMTFNETAPEHLIRQFGKELPVHPDELQRFRAVGCIVKDISDLDLSFDTFWKVYDYKIAPMKCKALWNKLSDEERIMALGYIPRLRNFYAKKQYDMPYPERFLKHRRWEDSLPVNN